MTNQTKSYYFAYGANTNFHSMAARCPGADFVGTVTLNEHQLTFRGVADVQPSKDHKVTGALWLITEQNERALDRFEGFPHLYIKKIVTVETEEGALIDTMIYVMRETSEVYPPEPGYFHCLHQGYTDSNIPLDQLFLAVKHAEEAERVFFEFNEING